jgi:hypothetical protein
MNLLSPEGQCWFKEDSDESDFGFGHIHLGGGMMPVYMPLPLGPVSFLLTFQMHDQEGTLQKLDFIGAGLRDPATSPWSPLIPYGDYEQIAVTRTYTVQPRPKDDGWQLIKPEIFLRDMMGRARKCRLSLQLNFGRGTVPTEHLMCEAWPSPSDTDGRAYSNATLHKQDIPLKPLSGLWSPRFRFHSSSGLPRHGFVSIDPSFHAGSRGTVLFEQENLNGDFRTLPVPIDTRALTNGVHKLCLKCSDRGMHPNGTMQGLLLVPFLVDNS